MQTLPALHFTCGAWDASDGTHIVFAPGPGEPFIGDTYCNERACLRLRPVSPWWWCGRFCRSACRCSPIPLQVQPQAHVPLHLQAGCAVDKASLFKEGAARAAERRVVLEGHAATRARPRMARTGMK